MTLYNFCIILTKPKLCLICYFRVIMLNALTLYMAFPRTKKYTWVFLIDVDPDRLHPDSDLDPQNLSNPDPGRIQVNKIIKYFKTSLNF